MKKIESIIFTIIFYSFFIGNTDIFCAVTIDTSTYRIAASHDGNTHDMDDIAAAPMVIALLAEAGVKDKFVHMDYSNHIWDGVDDQKVPNQPELMVEAVEGACDRWGVSKSLVFDVSISEELTKAKANFKLQGEASSENDQLYYACGGPMEVPYQCIMEVSSAKRQYITAISHSSWNEDHSHGGSRTWTDIKTTGCKTVEIKGQNIGDFNHTIPNYHWLRDMGGKYEWLFNRNQKETWDASDAGITWYIITGRGDEEPIIADIETVFNSGYVTDSIAPTQPGTPVASEISKTSVQLNWVASTDSFGVAGYDILQNGSVIKTSADTSSLVKGLWCGNSYYLKIRAKDAAGNLSELSDSILINTPECDGTEVDPYAIKIGPDFIVFDAENTTSDLGNWKIVEPGDPNYKDSEVSPINNTHLEFQGGGGSPLEYTFICPKTAKYGLVMRMWQRKFADEANDKANDVFIKMSGNFTSGGDYTDSELRNNMKFFGRGTPDWGSCFKGESHESGKHQVFYNLIEGEEYTFTMTGRSARCNIDYILFFAEGLPIEFGSYQDVAALNDSMYRPDNDIRYRYSTHEIRAVDFNKYTGIDGFSDASTDNKGGLDILSIPTRDAWAAAQYYYQGTDGQAWFNLNAMQEEDGESTYILKINGVEIGRGTNDTIYGTGIPDYTIQKHIINDSANKVDLLNGDTIQVEFNNTTNGEIPEGEEGLTATARGRWFSIELTTSGTFDAIAPSKPGTPNATNISKTSIDLEWAASTDNIAVTGYEILSGGSVIKEVSGTSTKMSGLECSTSYTYTIRARDAVGNISEVSNEGNFITTDCSSPDEEEETTYVETLTNCTNDGDWMNKTFMGDDFEWTVEHVKYSTEIGSGAGLYTRKGSITSETIPGGISSFSIDLYNKWNSSGEEVKFGLFINDVLIDSNINTTNQQLYSFSINDINIDGDIVISARNISDVTTTILMDNISWSNNAGSSDTTHLTEHELGASSLVYPNPFTSDYLQVLLTNNNVKQINLLDTKGAVVLTKDVSTQKEQTQIITISTPENLESGVYFLQLIGDESNKTIKLLKL